MKSINNEEPQNDTVAAIGIGAMIVFIALILVVVHRVRQLEHLLRVHRVLGATVLQRGRHLLDEIRRVRDRLRLLLSLRVAIALEFGVGRPVGDAVRLAVLQHLLEQLHHLRDGGVTGGNGARAAEGTPT